MSLDDQTNTQQTPSPAGASATAVPRVQSTINVAANQGTVIGTQIINQAHATPALHQLRASVGDFVGRAAEIDQLVQALSAASGNGTAAIGCVRGMAGVGKTELAYTVAQQLNASFPDAQLLVDLRGVSPTPLSPAQALQTLIRAFEREAKLPDELDELTGLYAAALAGKRALILADDAQDVAQVRSLLPPPGCALLVTSRNRFALPAMRAIDLPPLPPQAAAQLLLAVCPRIGTDAEALAKQCGYLPLALRVSAGLLATNDARPVSSCLAHLGVERLSYLSDPDDPAANVETSLRLSYDDLTPDGQAGLCQLSVFPASFDAAAAQAVVAIAADVSEALELLRRYSLLEWDAALERYSLQDLVRVYGAARLEAADAVRLRHAQHYMQVASFAVQDLYLKGQALAGLALFDRERAQIDAGWSWARERAGDPNADELLLSYARATLDVSSLRYNARTERIPQMEACLLAARRLGRRDHELAALSNLGNAYADLGDVPKAIDNYEQALVIAREIGDPNAEADAAVLAQLRQQLADGHGDKAAGAQEGRKAKGRKPGWVPSG